MTYSAETVKKALRALETEKQSRRADYDARMRDAYARVPRLREIDRELRTTGAKVVQAAFQGGDPLPSMEALKQRNLALQQERAELEKQFAPGYLEENPVCGRCNGSGYIGECMCGCLKSYCAGILKQELSVMGANRFEDFRLEYYPERVDRETGISPRALMAKTLAAARQYGQNFRPGCGNLLFSGGTGLGKTFLSACIAACAAERGYGVAYESAPGLFAMLEKNRFNRTSPDTESVAREQYLSGCDLLIIDDLGTEMTTGFVIAALYELVNNRLLTNASMIISTNLNIDEIARRYSPQIASRLHGQFKRMTFIGEDVRVMKNRGVSF